MKKTSLAVWYSLLLLLSLNAAAVASDVTISGSARFKCNLLSKYMEKNGYYFIKELQYNKNLKTNIFAAKDAEITIKNRNDSILGSGTSDKEGNFSISVPEANTYQVVIRFHDRKIEFGLSLSDVKDYVADMGYFDTEIVGSWIQEPALNYCYTCSVRYHENRESLLASEAGGTGY